MAEVRCFRTLCSVSPLLWPRNGILSTLVVGSGDGGRGGGKNTRVGDRRRSEELGRWMPRLSRRLMEGGLGWVGLKTLGLRRWPKRMAEIWGRSGPQEQPIMKNVS
ncbi:neuraminidase [Striga asiatica]|uniref:Neuraminidase n=1 Tax=Striga asiatica TaxID=4170 RepID=A0A5A7PXK6_STRAF|nr:neuraminidase [Striga asiatica]